MTEPSSGVQTRWDRRRERTHHRLLHAAERLFITQGFDTTTVEEIAVAADVAKGTFFNYFSSKESLLGELVYLRIRPLLDALPAEDATATDRILALLTGIRRELSPYADLFRPMAIVMLTSSLPKLPPEGHMSLAHAVARLVREGQDKGEFRRTCDAEVAGALIATYFFRLCVMECLGLTPTEFCWEDRLRAALDILYRGLCVPETAPLAPGAVSHEAPGC